MAALSELRNLCATLEIFDSSSVLLGSEVRSEPIQKPANFRSSTLGVVLPRLHAGEGLGGGLPGLRVGPRRQLAQVIHVRQLGGPDQLGGRRRGLGIVQRADREADAA